jgi:hypothetical protein
LRRENIAEERIVLAVLHTAESWNSKLKVVATPPAVGVDVTLPGGVAVAMEMGLGRDPQAGRNHRTTAEHPTSSPRSNLPQRSISSHLRGDGDGGTVNSMSSWSTHMDASETKRRIRGSSSSDKKQFDANTLVPWSFELSAKGSVSHEKLSIHILKLEAKHEEVSNGATFGSQVAARGSIAIWKVRPEVAASSESSSLRRSHHRTNNYSAMRHHPELQTEESPSVAAILMSTDETTTTSSFHDDLCLLQYDYVFDVHDNSKIDAITVSVGATHPMLDGGTMVTTILDSIYAYGSVSARENAILDPKEMNRKRNILRHLPATDFHFGIQNIFIPPESDSYSDDGQTLFLPELERGRVRVHLLGGICDTRDDASAGSNGTPVEQGVAQGIKLVADFEAPSLQIYTEGRAKEFPEFEIFDGVNVRTFLHGIIGGSIRAHLRPQKLSGTLSTTGPNVFNPLEAYEIDFSRSSLSVKMKEYTVSLGHRRVIFPAESTFVVEVLNSVVDMGFEGKTQCELIWDFQGLSPILQVTPLGQSPEDAVPENKKQVSILIAPLRQGRLSFHVSPVGGISITKAATSREDKEGLYDWKLFNALVSPDEESAGRIIDVLHDKRTMDKLLQVVKLINEDLCKTLRYLLRQVWRAKEILDMEGVSDPKHAIPMYNMSRILCLFLTGDVEKVDTILPIMRRVVEGEGLDVVKMKELLRDHLEQYDDWAPEIDRGVRWLSVAFGPMTASQPCVEQDVLPLAEMPHHADKFRNIPSAAQLYDTLLDKPQLPLAPAFSSLVSRVAPYLSFRQIEFILRARASTDWQPSDLRRIRYVYTIKRKVLEIAESYGGLSFLPQSFLVSVFLGEATRSSHRALQTRDGKKRRPRTLESGASVQSRSRLRTSGGSSQASLSRKRSTRPSILSRLRRRRVEAPDTRLNQVAELQEEASSSYVDEGRNDIPTTLFLNSKFRTNSAKRETYQLGDCLLGPQDVAILLQAGLTSVMKSSSVVQLNQRMLLDLIGSQPTSFAVAVLAEIGNPSGQGSPRSLTSALMSLLELDQTSFKENHKIDMHALLESWLPGLKIPRREDYMAGGRWARQSYYEALVSVAKSILDDAETYMALKGHVQRARRHKEGDPLPRPRNEPEESEGVEPTELQVEHGGSASKLRKAVELAKASIDRADAAGKGIMESLIADEKNTKQSDAYKNAVSLYRESFIECARVLLLDKHAFHADWFRRFYKRNYDALMIKSMLDNAVEDVDNTRHW